MAKTNKELAQHVWRSLSGDERHAFHNGTMGGMSARSYVAKTYGQRFNISQEDHRPLTAWSHLVALCDAWKRGEEDDGSEEPPEKTKTHKFSVPVTYTTTGWITIEAANLDNAKAKAREMNETTGVEYFDINDSESTSECHIDEIEPCPT